MKGAHIPAVEKTVLPILLSMEEVMRRITSFVVGGAMGALVGATLAILLAPYSGEDLRTEVRNRINRVQEDMQNAAAQRRHEMEARLAALRTGAADDTHTA